MARLDGALYTRIQAHQPLSDPLLSKALERTIILFDEIEEFCLDRDNPALGMER